MTSHAAVVARGMGKPCVAGCDGLSIDATASRGIAGHELREGDVITIDGGTGRVFIGEVPLVPPQLNEDFETILGWADELAAPRACARTPTRPTDAARAREFGAEGIGLCRTEHMFFGEERLPVVQEMILADDRGRPPRRARPAAAVPAGRLRGDLRGDGRAAGDDPAARPAAARVPAARGAGDRRADARADPRAARDEPDARHARLPARAHVPGDLRDADPRDRPRGRAPSSERTGDAPLVEIMHPLVGFAEELRRLRELTERVWAEEAPELAHLVGTMIEVPRACIRAGEIAETRTSSRSARTT